MQRRKTMWTRRAFLKSGGLALFSVSVGGTPLFLSRAADAAVNPNRRKVLVTIFQRGAMDGLMAISPFNDPMLTRLRPRLAMTAAKSAGENALIDLDGNFGLHPAFAPMHPLFQEKRLAIVHGVGSPDETRSHFDAQDYMETGTPGRKGTRSGWLNRAVGLLGHEATPFRAVSMTQALPRSLYGDESSLAIANLANFGVKVPGNKRVNQEAEALFKSLYTESSQELLQRAGQESFEAVEMLKSVQVANYQPANGAEYPRSPLGNSLRQVAQLIKADVGLEIAFAETGGWDTHVQQGTTIGSFARRAADLAQSITAFWRDVESYQDDVVLMTMTEFGRTVHENGSGGTDHGRGSCLFILGNRVDGGKIHGNVPPLVAESLDKRSDLPVTTDFRAVFAEVAGKHLDIDDNQTLFPGWAGKRLPLMN
jgi:uncharacterized protein (DUF1501 family)